MNLISVSIFAYDDYGMFITDNNISNPNNIELQKSIVDELYIQTDVNENFDIEKESWKGSTVLKAEFKNNLIAGNFDIAGLEIQELRFKRRKINDNKWIQFATAPYNKDIQLYEVKDKLNESYQDYEYAVTAYASGIEGDYKSKTIESWFEYAFILDKDNTYKIAFNRELGEITYHIPSTSIETLDGEYAIVRYNANTNYRTSNLKCLLLTDSTVENCGAIDIKNEKILRQNIIKWLNNKKPKIIKDKSGNAIGCNIQNSRLIPRNDLDGVIYELTFDFIETFDINNETSLLRANMI